MTMMLDPRRLDPRCVTSVTLDTRATTSATPTGRVPGGPFCRRPRFVGQWNRNARGQLACTWGQDSANEPGEPHYWRQSDISLPPVQPPSPVLTTRQWTVLASVLAVAGLETVICAWIGAGAPF